MSERSVTHDLSGMEIAMDTWTRPFWDAAAQERLVVPRCDHCGHFRWPPGPFCPECHAQDVQWVDPGAGRLYSFTVLRRAPAAEDQPFRMSVPALIRFAEAGNIIILGALVDAPIDGIAIDAPVAVAWSQAANTKVPVFRLA